jgi:hypothetical protein
MTPPIVMISPSAQRPRVNLIPPARRSTPKLPGVPVCKVCHLSDEKLLWCGQCHAQQYCGKECQRSDWRNGHKEACLQNKPVNVADRRPQTIVGRKTTGKSNFVSIVQQAIIDPTRRQCAPSTPSGDTSDDKPPVQKEPRENAMVFDDVGTGEHEDNQVMSMLARQRHTAVFAPPITVQHYWGCSASNGVDPCTCAAAATLAFLQRPIEPIITPSFNMLRYTSSSGVTSKSFPF